MKNFLLAAILLTTGCSTLAPKTGTFGEGAVNVGLTILAAKAASNCIINCYPMYQPNQQPAQPQVIVAPIVIQAPPAVTPVAEEPKRTFDTTIVYQPWDDYKQYK